MGITLNAAFLMMIEGQRRPYSGSVLQLGRQNVLLNYAQLEYLAHVTRYPLTPIDVEQPGVWLNDEQFFTALGFSEIHSMEYGTTENASYRWDLNYPVTASWHEQYDFIYDGGTIEHVFHVPNALESICYMLKVNGRVFHESAASGSIDHGFYALQPTLFHDYYLAQGFQNNLLTVSKLNHATMWTQPGEQTLYQPGMYDFNKTWTFDAEHIFVGICFATKLRTFRGAVIPQQSMWARQAAA
jgi:hypothetical protein